MSLAPVKAAIDEHMKKLQDAMVSSLRRKVPPQPFACCKYLIVCATPRHTKCTRSCACSGMNCHVNISTHACSLSSQQISNIHKSLYIAYWPDAQAVAEKEQIEEFVRNGKELFDRQVGSLWVGVVALYQLKC